ncbi:MAG: CHAT domain-containing tetratricopeptide repeat protein [Bacteroidia bacterium]|nr:CHAT domain-containing tetratricopeptide repeat protein [Bacteroidia bacterium]
MTRKEFQKAVRKLNTSLQVLKKAKINSDILRTKIESYLHLGYCYTETGNHDSSIVFAHEALKMQQKLPFDLDYTYFLISGAYFHKGAYAIALDTVKLSIKYAHNSYGERHRLVGRSYVLLGRILRKQGKTKNALEAFQKALIAYSRQFSDPDILKNPDLKDITSQKGVLHTLENKNRTLLMLLEDEPDNKELLQAAINTNKLSIKLIGELRKDYLHDYSKFHLLSQAMPTYEMGLKTASLRDPTKSDPAILAEAFKISEQGKSMILQDNLRSANALIDSNVPENLKRKEDSLRSNIGFYGRRINLFESREKLNSFDSVQYQSSKRIYLESEEAYSELMRFLKINYEDYSRRKDSLKSKNLSQIFQYLDSTHLSMLEYFWGEKAIYAFRLHKGEIRMFEMEKDSSLIRDIENFRNQVSDASEVYNRGNSQEAFERYKETGYRIYQRLLEPLLSEVEEYRNLVIIPDGPLNVFPFEALPFQAEKESRSFRELDYLIKRHQIHYALSADLLLKGFSRKNNSYGFLGYAPSYEGARKLDFNTQEVNEIADMVNGKAIVGEEANKSHFLKKSRDGQFLHMAQHAIKAEDPMLSHLLFSKDAEDNHMQLLEEDAQRLYAYEIYNQRMDCELAVLNACETGEGKMAQGEGMLSLSRAFRHAGARSVIMNKWAVNDESSFRILSEFYKYLKEGESTASALRNAKLYYLNNSNKAHPYFWAGSALIGGSSPLAFPEEKFVILNSKEGLYIFVLICCLGMAFFMAVFYQIQRKRRKRAALFEEL